MLATHTADPQVPVIERRRSRRRRALIRARIIFRDGYCSMGCLILNISDKGALLQPDDVITCPKTFILKPRFAPQRHCEIVWRKIDQIGVRFL